jgi:DNA-binding GntR family transcriptional regulator
MIFKTRTEYVLEVLRREILRGKRTAGEPLRQESIATQLEVSRIPVREALLQLEAEGLVEFVAHKGALVSPISITEIVELFYLRSILESDLLAACVDKFTPQILDEAASKLSELDAALDKQHDVDHWSEMNQAFHRVLYQAAQKPLQLDIIGQLNRRSDRYIRMQLMLTKGVSKAEKQHQQILRYCAANDVQAASQLLKSHILQAGSAIADYLVQQKFL